MRTWTEDDIRNMLTLYAVTDRAWLGERSFGDVLAEALSVPGVTCVQLREKRASAAEREALAREAQRLCAQVGIPFLIDDDVELAARIGADGAHIGQDDRSCAEARAMLGEQAIIGVTTKTLEQALRAQADGADYLGVGAVFPTSTKQDTWTIDHDVLRQICEQVSIPVVAIGGITAQNAPTLAGTGVAGIAVVSAIFAQENIPQAVEELSREARALRAGE
ncbi:thiamine phosphate synthase [Anaerotardibacter muris]|uniref:thiamine phosphate synthase n=1 Tax=Anaerotardibacter muris TaxID=2941505 RepID=UPI00203D6B91|nr:thiamine phosphate synthase [Anaerotardibacter muris]